MVQLRRALCMGSRGRSDRRQAFVFHNDRFGCIGRLRKSTGEHGGNRFSHMAHNLTRERKTRRFGHGPAIARMNDPQRPHGTDPVVRQVVAAEHGSDAGMAQSRRSIEAGYPRMRMG